MCGSFFKMILRMAGAIVQQVVCLQPTQIHSPASYMGSQALPGAIPDYRDRSKP